MWTKQTVFEVNDQQVASEMGPKCKIVLIYVLIYTRLMVTSLINVTIKLAECIP